MIWLLRHGDAGEEAGDDDDARLLTPNGVRQAEHAGRALLALGAKLDRCLSSPKPRAVEMAKLACEPLGLTVETSDQLAGPDFDPLDLTAGREVLLVGHEPGLLNTIAQLTGAAVALKRGGLAAIDGGELRALLDPDHVERICRSSLPMVPDA